jgi:cytochrome b subunit of formate dehydrogenase
VWDNIRYYTWLGNKRVEFSRYDYSQKAEYWALIWGTVLMILSGLILWFPQWSVKIFPSWIVPAAQTVHYYEAWLATLAVLVWHFFFVIFHPEQYPMSWTWLTGKMSEEEVRTNHGRWYREISADRSGRDPGDEKPAEEKEPAKISS